MKGLCGDRNYEVVDANTGSPNAIAWITVTKDLTAIDTHTITFNPDDISLVTGAAHTYYLKTTYAEYAAHAPQYTTMSVQVTAATCDCSLLQWDNPTEQTLTVNVGVAAGETFNIPVATVNTASKSAS